MPNPILVGHIGWKLNGDAYVIYSASSQAVFNVYATKFGEKQVKSVVSGLTAGKIRSVEQNNYYWGVVLEIIADDLGYIGPGEKEDLHNELRSMFLVRIGKLGEPYVESTTRIDTKLFERYLEAIRTFMLNKYQIRIPLPNEAESSDDSATYRKL
jgi:hypothetical protein